MINLILAVSLILNVVLFLRLMEMVRYIRDLKAEIDYLASVIEQGQKHGTVKR